jgi:hypothetical protein
VSFHDNISVDNDSVDQIRGHAKKNVAESILRG